MLKLLLVSIVAYLVGSLNTAIFISVFHKNKDIRDYGSKSAGMTNMLRVFGKKAAIFTLIGDFFKGFIIVTVSRFLCGDSFSFDIGYVAAIFAVLGHVFPIYFEFRGGKGIATSFGTLLALNPIVFLTILIGLVPMLYIVRIVSAISLTGASLYPVLTFLVLTLEKKDMLMEVIPNTLFSLVIAAFTFYAHRENIKRFKSGNENFFGDKNNEKTD